MSLRKAYVVATHPEDNSVDLIIAKTGERLVGVQLQTKDGSTRTGSVDLPHVPAKPNKWDISKETDQEMIASVAMMDGEPLVTGFVYPQVNQITPKDPKTKSYRHQSDVGYSIDGDGNIQINHPSGTYIRIGETPDRVETEGANADGNAKVDRNTGRKVNVRIGLAGNTVVLTMTPDGGVTFAIDQDFNIVAKGGINMEALGAINLKSPVGIVTDAPTVQNPSGDIIAKTVSLMNHTTTLVKGGEDESGPPAQ